MKLDLLKEETEKYDSLEVWGYVDYLKQNPQIYGRIHPKAIELLLNGLALERQENIEEKCRKMLIDFGMSKRKKLIITEV